MNELLSLVLEHSGLPTVIRLPAISRALRRSGVEPEQLDPEGLSKALASIRTTLRVYLSDDEARRRLEAIGRLAELGAQA